MRKKKRLLPDNEATTPVKRGRPKESTLLSRYPAFQFIEDEVGVSRSQAKLCEEAVKPTPSKASVLSLQRPTFATRREFILSGLDSVGAILEQHPVLHLPFAVSALPPLQLL